MDMIDLQSLAQLVARSNGYLVVNRSTDELETRGSNFLGKMVSWVRFKTNRKYRQAALDAKQKVVDSMLSDHEYGHNFRKRIAQLERSNVLFSENKPLSIRAVRRFISEVQDEVKPHLRAVRWINWFSDQVNTIASHDNFDESIKTMLAEKIKYAPGLSAADVDLKAVGDEIQRVALSDDSAVAAITNQEHAREHVTKAMSAVLDQRIAEASLKLKDELNRHLSAAGLPEAARKMLRAQIVGEAIVTLAELDAQLHEQTLKCVSDELDDLYAQVGAELGFSEKVKRFAEVKEQLLERLAHGQPLVTMSAARQQAKQLLGQWVQDKQAALAAIQPPQFAGVDQLLRRLVLQDPLLDKAQLLRLQRPITRTLEAIYARDSAAYEALGMDRGKFLSKLQQFHRGDLLFNDLRDLLKQVGTHSLFDSHDSSAAIQPPTDAAAQLSADVKTVVRDYVVPISRPLIKGYAQVAPLKGKIPDALYTIAWDALVHGETWNPELIAEVNGYHINRLVDHAKQGFYELLLSPQVAKVRIGSKENLQDFTLEELLQSLLDGKQIKDLRQRCEAIDRVIPEAAQEQFLGELEAQLAKVKSTIMSEADAQALFQRAALRFLRAQKISFEEARATVELPPSAVYMESAL